MRRPAGAYERKRGSGCARACAARPAGSLSRLVAAEFCFELLDAEEQLVDIALAAHQAGVHRGGRLQLFLDPVPTPDVLDRDRRLLRKGLQLLEVASGDRIQVVAIDI